MNSTMVPAPPEGRSVVAPSDLGSELTSGFAGRHIGYKARQVVGRYGYVTADRPDLEQELRLRLFLRVSKFDPRRGNWNSFVVAVVDRQVATLATAHEAKLRWEAFQRMLAQSRCGIDEDDSAEPDAVQIPARPCGTSRGDRRELDVVDLRLDMAVIVPRLPYELRIVWEWLQSDNVRRTARALRVSPMTIYQRMKRLRAIFLAAELKNSCRNYETLRGGNR